MVKKMSKHSKETMNAKKEEKSCNGKGFTPIENPYFPFELETGKWFFHEDVVAEINRIFKDKQNRVITIKGIVGTGKTSTLISLANNRSLIEGDNIIIYLDARNYDNLPIDKLLLNTYNDIARTIKKFGYNLKEPDFPKSQDITPADIKSLIQPFKILQKDGVTLILVLDEFEGLLESEEGKIIEITFDIFQAMLKEYSYFKLILAGDKEIGQLSKIKNASGILEKASHVKIDGELTEEKIKKLITEPENIKTRNIYKEDAINRIIWLSGKNLYFQQLICFYIVNYLNQEKRDVCDLDVVAKAVEMLLNDPTREDLNYAWKYKLTQIDKLIFSALADEIVTRKEGQYYYLKRNSILDDILGDQLHDHINQLTADGKLHRIDERRFSEFPFKIPLFGMWIRKNHPFKKTIRENLKGIAEISLYSLGKIIERNPGLIERDDEKNKTLLEFSRRWFLLEQKVKRDMVENDLLQDFVQTFARLILGIDANKVKQWKGGYFSINIEDLKIGQFEEAVLFIQKKIDIDRTETRYIQNFILSYDKDNLKTTFIFLYFHRNVNIEELLEKEFLNLIAIYEENLKPILLSPYPSTAFKEDIIIKQIKPSLLNPYQVEGAVTTTFYGRLDTRRRILSLKNRNFSIVGVRKIGKSSLLLNVIKNLPADTCYIHMDLTNCIDYDVFLERLEFEINKEFHQTINLKNNLTKFHRDIKGLVNHFKAEGKKLIFIFDEVDSLIHYDKKHECQLVEIFRSLSNEGYTRFIIAGFTELFHYKRSIDSPLYNFGDEIKLGHLDDEAALNLITEPMENIGISYYNETDRNLILKYTSQHPSLLQFYCRQLVKRVEKHPKESEKRTIFRKDIEDVFTEEYKHYIIHDIYMFRSKELRPINEFIILLLAENYPEENSFSIDNVLEKLRECDIKIEDSDLLSLLQELEIRYILKEPKVGKYEFALPQFPDMLKESMDIDSQKKILSEEIKRDGY
jgi:Cdc6-like AAA superfamily ATPase